MVGTGVEENSANSVTYSPQKQRSESWAGAGVQGRAMADSPPTVTPASRNKKSKIDVPDRLVGKHSPEGMGGVGRWSRGATDRDLRGGGTGTPSTNGETIPNGDRGREFRTGGCRSTTSKYEGGGLSALYRGGGGSTIGIQYEGPSVGNEESNSLPSSSRVKPDSSSSESDGSDGESSESSDLVEFLSLSLIHI